MEKINIGRKAAAALIENIREQLAAGCDAEAIALILAYAGIPVLEKCDGPAHENAHIDNCGCCAPRWGFVGPAVVVR